MLNFYFQEILERSFLQLELWNPIIFFNIFYSWCNTHWNWGDVMRFDDDDVWEDDDSEDWDDDDFDDDDDW